MTVSIIVPVFNCISYLTACVESILSAGIRDCEIILVDDGSTDGSGSLCDALAQKHPEVQAVHQPNSGVSAARNRGIKLASGERLLFVDADDSLEGDALREVLEDTRCRQADLVIFGLTFDYYYHGKCYRRDLLYYDENEMLTINDWGKNVALLFSNGILSSACNKIFRRDLLLQHDLLFDTGMFLYEDLAFVLRYLCCCGSIWNVPKAIYHYRQSEDEGNAGRRLSRIESLPEFLLPIEAVFAELLRRNPAVSAEQKDRILQQLYLVLAREKISVSDLAGIRRICREYAQWAQQHEAPLGVTKFENNLREQKAAALLISDKKTALRHRVAVWVKSHCCR